MIQKEGLGMVFAQIRYQTPVFPLTAISYVLYNIRIVFGYVCSLFFVDKFCCIKSR